jgi:hypothetical protein
MIFGAITLPNLSNKTSHQRDFSPDADEMLVFAHVFVCIVWRGVFVFRGREYGGIVLMRTPTRLEENQLRIIRRSS